MSSEVAPIKEDDVKLESTTELGSLLESLNIKYIFSYDDEWDMDRLQSEVDGKRKELLETDYVSFSKTFAIRILEQEETYILNEALSTVKEIIDSESDDLKRLRILFSKTLDKNRVSNPLLALKEVLDKLETCHGVSIKINPCRFNIKDVEGIEGRILFLLDMNMGESIEENDVVIKTILEINRSRPDNHDIAVVYSHEQLDMYKRHNDKIHYVQSYLEQNKQIENVENEALKYLIPFQLWAISKADTDGKLMDILKSTLEKAAFGYSLHDYLEMKMQITQKATINLIKLSEETFDGLYKDSFIEGEIFLDILDRTHQTVMSKVEYETIKANPGLYDNILTVSKLKNQNILKDIQSQGVRKYRSDNDKKKTDPSMFKDISEYGLLDYTVNSTYSDIMTGDIFEFITHESVRKQYGILVTTDCDLPLRPRGNEIMDLTRNAQLSTLLLCDHFQFSEDDEGVKKKIIDPKVEGIWPVLNDGQYQLLIPDTKTALMNINSMILDLCSINNDGWAKLRTNLDPISIYKTHYFNEYYKTEMSKWVETIDKISSYIPAGSGIYEAAATAASREDDTNISQLISIMAGLKYTIKLDLDNEKFILKRIGRLETRRTLQIIQTKVNYMSRIGLTSIPGA